VGALGEARARRSTHEVWYPPCWSTSCPREHRSRRGQGTRNGGRRTAFEVSKKLRQGSQADTDSCHGLFDTQGSPGAGGASLSE